jgi:uncharacterized protein Yka (UPF0111/DUF47 family)
MLRKLIRKILPAKSDIFFELFVESANTAYDAANIFASIINVKQKSEWISLSNQLRQAKHSAHEINKKILIELNNQFITPIDRGDVQELAVLLLKLTKRIVKTNSKLQIYAIDIETDDCLTSSAKTLQNITHELVEIMQALAKGNHQKIASTEQKTDELDENAIDDLRNAMKDMYSGNYDTMTVLKLKEVYKSIESAIDISADIADLVVQISVKDM